MVRKTLLTRALIGFMTVAILSLGAVGFGPIKTALAFPRCSTEPFPGNFSFGFICDRPQPNSPVINNGDAYDVKLSGTPNGYDSRNDYPPYRTIAAGHTINFTSSFTATGIPRYYDWDDNGSPDAKAGATVVMWTTIDANNSVTTSNGGSINAGSGTQTNCPGAGGRPAVNFFNDSPYNGDSVNCGPYKTKNINEGQMVAWAATASAGQTVSRNFSFQLPYTVPNPVADYICVTNYVSIWEHDGHLIKAATFNPDGSLKTAAVYKDGGKVYPFNDSENLKYGAGRSKRECYQIVRETATVHVRSSEPGEEDATVTGNVGTGKNLVNVPIHEEKQCGAYAPGNATINPLALPQDKNTGGTGDASFRESTGGGYCIIPPPSWQDPSTGQNYKLRTPLSNNGEERPIGADPNDPTTDFYGKVYQVAGVYCADRSIPTDTSSFDTDCGSGSGPERKYDDDADDYTSNDSFTFIYDPMPEPPAVSKTDPYNGSRLETASSPTCTADRENPVCKVTYTITVRNGYDANFSETNIIDLVPLNLRQDPGFLPTIDSVKLEAENSSNCTTIGWCVPTQQRSGGVSGGALNYSTCGPPDLCNGFGENIFYDYGKLFGTPVNDFFQVAYLLPDASTGGRVVANFPSLPAYSIVTLVWHGYVKPTKGIGVYPAKTPPSLSDPYCLNPMPGTYTVTDPTLIQVECEDRDPNGTGFEGVANYAYTSVGGAEYVNNSPYVFRPIPAGIGCISKNVEQGTGKYEVDNPTITDATCTSSSDGTSQTAVDPATGNPVRQIFSDSGPYAIFNFEIKVHGLPQSNINNNWGPAYYQVFDQQCPDATAPSIDDSAGCKPADTSFRSYSGIQAPISDETPPFTISSSQYPTIGTYLYGYGVTRIPPNTNVGGAGYIHTYTLPINAVAGLNKPDINKSIFNKACYRTINFSVLPHTTSSGCSLPTDSRFLRIVAPIIDSHKGNVAAGGNPNDVKPCVAGSYPSLNDPRIVTNNPSNGARYLVTTSGGQLAGLRSLAGAVPPATDSLYNTFCYPDLSDVVSRYVNKYPTRVGTTDGDVDTKVGDYVISAPMTVSTRYTMHVKGNLFIRNNITYDPSKLGASLGVIVDGSIYIDKNVTQLDGYYYASPKTGSPVSGLINTCAYDQTKTLDKDKISGSGPSATYDSGECGQQLNVRGLLIANAFRFNRTTTNIADTNQTPLNASEYIQGLGEAYILTPPGFSDVTQNNLAPKGLKNILPRY